MAGRGGRNRSMGFTRKLAAALVMMGAPGTRSMGSNIEVAGRGGRKPWLGFTRTMAAAG
jgi:hypothetical protein